MFQAWNMGPTLSWRKVSGSLNPVNSDLLLETFSLLSFFFSSPSHRTPLFFFFFFSSLFFLNSLCALGYLSVVFLMGFLHRKGWTDQITGMVRTFYLGESCGFSCSSCQINPTGIFAAISLFKSMMKPRKWERTGFLISWVELRVASHFRTIIHDFQPQGVFQLRN